MYIILVTFQRKLKSMEIRMEHVYTVINLEYAYSSMQHSSQQLRMITEFTVRVLSSELRTFGHPVVLQSEVSTEN
jgi:hypothetical protein